MRVKGHSIAKSYSGLKKATGGVNFRCGEGIGLNQSFEAQLWRSRRTERPLTGARVHSLHPNIASGYEIIFFSRLLEALICDLGIYEGFRLKTLKTLYSYLLANSVE